MTDVYKAYLKSEKALKAFLRRYYKRAEDVEDAAQETFLRAFAAEARKEIEAPKEFLFQIAKNFALNDITRKAKTTTDYIEDMASSPALADRRHVGADESLSSREKLLAVVRAVAELPPQCRRVFIMRKFDGMKVKDIAKRLNVSVSNVEKHIAAGVVKCADHLAAHGFDEPHRQVPRKESGYIGGRRPAEGFGDERS